MAIKDWPGGVISKTPIVPAGSNANSAASGVWTLDQVAYWVKQGIWPNPANVVDPYFYDVTLLLTGDGTNGAQNNTFLDSSTNNFTITRNGNTTQGTFSPYGNLWSNYFDGTGDYLTVPSNAAFNMGTNDWTVEAWVYQTSSSARGIFQIGTGHLNSFEGGIGVGVSGTVGNPIRVYIAGSGVDTTAYLNNNSWNHLAFVRNGTALNLYLNGVSVYGTTNTSDLSSYTYLTIGGWYSSSFLWYGYISNLRIVKGTAVYTSNFTPSTTPLTAVSGTSLLTCQSNRFIDTSSNNFTITRNGDVSVQRFSPFNPTAPYSAATVGGSGYFDGTGDYLNTPASGQFAPTGDFTIGVWFYPLALPTYSEVIGNYTANNATDWLFEIAANGALAFYTNGAAIRIQSSAGAIKIGQWHYISMSRSGTTITGYLNGTSVGTYTQSGTFGSASKTIYIGSQAGSYLANGYLSDVKLIDGSAVTTVPTAPFTATTGTKLLLNFTNAGIPDAAMMNDLETVGNAQVSTSVKKYGTGSLAFDGSGDWLTSVSTPQYDLGSGNFTIECWLYLANLSTSYGIFAKRADTNTGYKWIVTQVNSSSGTIRTTVATSNSGWAIDANTTSAVSATTWTHIAYVRNGSDFSVYVNGVKNTLSSSLSGSIYMDTEPLVIGAAGTSGSYTWPLNGYIDDLRITKGYARYTSSFTPPTAAFPTY